jgi:hypothetical protein
MVGRCHRDHSETPDVDAFDAGRSGVFRTTEADAGDPRQDELLNGVLIGMGGWTPIGPGSH